VFFFISPVAGCAPRRLGEVIPPGTNGQLDWEVGLVLPASRGAGAGRTVEPSEGQEPLRGEEHHLSDW
jgi:hypothetical protein